MARKNPDEPPTLNANIASVEKYLKWIAYATSHDLITTSVAKECNNAARGMIAAIKAREGLEEMEELRELIRRSEQAAERRRRNEVEDRYASGADDGLTMRVKRARA